MRDLKVISQTGRQTNRKKCWLTGEPSHVGSGELKKKAYKMTFLIVTDIIKPVASI